MMPAPAAQLRLIQQLQSQTDPITSEELTILVNETAKHNVKRRQPRKHRQRNTQSHPQTRPQWSNSIRAQTYTPPAAINRRQRIRDYEKKRTTGKGHSLLQSPGTAKQHIQSICMTDTWTFSAPVHNSLGSHSKYYLQINRSKTDMHRPKPQEEQSLLKQVVRQRSASLIDPELDDTLGLSEHHNVHMVESSCEQSPSLLPISSTGMNNMDADSITSAHSADDNSVSDSVTPPAPHHQEDKSYLPIDNQIVPADTNALHPGDNEDIVDIQKEQLTCEFLEAADVSETNDHDANSSDTQQQENGEVDMIDDHNGDENAVSVAASVDGLQQSIQSVSSCSDAEDGADTGSSEYENSASTICSQHDVDDSLVDIVESVNSDEQDEAATPLQSRMVWAEWDSIQRKARKQQLHCSTNTSYSPNRPASSTPVHIHRAQLQQDINKGIPIV